MAHSTFTDWLRFAAVTVQFAILSVLVLVYQVESRGFRWLLALAGIGFVIHHLLPLRFRMPFFALLSISSMVAAFGPPFSGENTLWLVALGLPLIGLAHLPIRFAFRVGLIALAACALAAVRGGVIQAPWAGAIWPAFGAMFMFRMMSYLYDLRTNSAPVSVWHALSYFFMLPSACFPLFPVVDYKAFCRSHYNGDACDIYQKGLVWIFRGVVQLMIYRYLYRNGPLNPADVTGAGSAALYMVTVYLLYLKVSGSFHVIAGLLHMFGFNLSETHHRYLLSSSFTDFWRRINIYWKDFIQKLFFYPVFFWTKRWGETAALTMATIAAFVVTWLLHAYQMFWILGRFPLIWTDMMFWAVLATLVVVSVLCETRKKKHRRLSATLRTWKSELRRAAGTMATFATIVALWSLWTAETTGQWFEQMSAYGDMTSQDALLIAGILLAVGVCGVLFGHSSSQQFVIAQSSSDVSHRRFWRTALQIGLATVVLLAVGTRPQLLQFAPELARASIQIRDDRLSTRDGARLVRGYYEDLTTGVRFNPELWGMYAQRPRDWIEIARSDIVFYSKDFLQFELKPSLSTIYKHARLETNSWGMRDRDYEKAKPPGVYRMLVVGASRAMGSGVANGEVFEALLEDRLNAELSPETGLTYEILNFAVGGYGNLRKMRVLEEKGYAFDPDALLYATSMYEASFGANDLARAYANDLDIPYEYLRGIVDEAGVSPGQQEKAVRARLERYGPEMMSWSWRRVAAGCDRRGIRMYVIIIPGTITPPAPPEFRRMVAEKADEHGFGLFDLSDLFENAAVPRSSLAVAPWDGHPNPEGHRMLADKLFDGLRPHLISEHDKATNDTVSERH